jgi:hypothetical protein
MRCNRRPWHHFGDWQPTRIVVRPGWLVQRATQGVVQEYETDGHERICSRCGYTQLREAAGR